MCLLWAKDVESLFLKNTPLVNHGNKKPPTARKEAQSEETGKESRARFLCGTFLFSPDFPSFVEQVELLFDLGHSLGRFRVFSFLLLNHGREFVYVKEL